MAKQPPAKPASKSSKPSSAAKTSGKPAKGLRQQNEGEGNKSAARRYNEGTKDFVKSGKVGAAAKAAEKAIEGAEGKELRKAEKAGLKHSRH
jgi:hypothetical protein